MTQDNLIEVITENRLPHYEPYDGITGPNTLGLPISSGVD